MVKYNRRLYVGDRVSILSPLLCKLGNLSRDKRSQSQKLLDFFEEVPE